jgi:cytochrome c5
MASPALRGKIPYLAAADAPSSSLRHTTDGELAGSKSGGSSPDLPDIRGQKVFQTSSEHRHGGQELFRFGVFKDAAYNDRASKGKPRT